MRGLLQARHVMRVRTKQAVYATTAFALVCASVYPFLAGHWLHSYWESWGKFLLLVSMTLWLPYVWVLGRAINAWIFLRSVKKIESEAH